MEARMREIGGRTVVFFLASPSSVFFVEGRLSINETVSARRGVVGGGAADGAAGGSGFTVFAGAFAGTEACERKAGLASGSFFFGAATFGLAAVDFDGDVVLRAADFAAVLLVVFVAI